MSDEKAFIKFNIDPLQTGESLTSNLETPHAGGPRAPQPLARTSLETRKPLAGTEKGGVTTGKAPRIEF